MDLSKNSMISPRKSARKCDCNLPGCDRLCSDLTSSDTALKIRTAVVQGDESVLEEILKTGIDIDAPLTYGLTPLMMAVLHRHQPIIKLLLEYGADTSATRLDMSDGDDNFDQDETVLHFAINFVSEDIVKLLITVEPNFVITSDEVFKKIVSYAVRRKNSKILRYLFRDKNLNELDSSIKNLILAQKIPTIDMLNKYGDSSLLLAIKEKKLQIVKMLLENGARLHGIPKYIDDNIVDISCSMLHVATFLYTENQDEDLIRLLSDYCDINELTGNGFTALHIAARSNKFELVKILVSLGADINKTTNYLLSNKWTPLHEALHNRNFEICKYFLDTEKLNQKTFASAASILVKHAYPSDYVNLILQSLLRNERKCPKNINLALHLAIIVNNQEVIDSVLNRISDVNKLKWRKLYPIHRAVKCNNIYCINRLLDIGGDIDLKDERYGMTALSYAVKKSNTSIILCLLSKGANIKSLEDDIKRDIHYEYAFGINNRRVFELLLDARINFKVFDHYMNSSSDMRYFSSNYLRHIIKLEAANMDINFDSLRDKFIGLKAEDENFANDCSKEIDKLKKEMISENSFISYYHFITKDIRRLANYTRNPEITSRFNFDHLRDNFPIYGQMIIISYGRALKRLELIQNLENLLFDVLIDVPLTFIRQIPNYLSENDLRTMLLDNK